MIMAGACFSFPSNHKMDNEIILSNRDLTQLRISKVASPIISDGSMIILELSAGFY